MPLEDLSKPVVVNKPDGTSVTLRRLTPSDRLKYAEQFRLYRKAQHFENLKFSGVVGAELVRQLDEFDGRRLTEGDAVEWVNTPPGRFTAVLMAMRKDNPNATEADVDAMDLDAGGMLRVAAGVLNLELIDRPLPLAAPEASSSSASPTPPDTNATGTVTPPLSPTGTESPTR